MIYTIEKATRVTELLQKFTTGYSHHVAGHYANIDFWLHEVSESLKTIDAYNMRFNVMKETQKQWVRKHDIRVFDYCPYCEGKCEFDDGVPPPPIRTSRLDLKEARKQVVDAMYYFLLRCYRIGLLDKTELAQKYDIIGTSIEPSDIEE